MSEDQVYLTKEKLEELKKELDYLKSSKRKIVALRIQEAKELGDLSENAEYAEAKDDQAWTEGRILELEDIIKKSVIVEECEKGAKSVVNIGCRVQVKHGAGEREFQIVGSQEANPAVGKISNGSPTGKAFLGKKVGDEVEVETPKGKIKYKILTVK